MAVDERSRVDGCFDAAKAALQPDPGVRENPQTWEAILMVGEAVVHALEGLSRQVRDTDDDVFQVKQAVESGFADLAIQVDAAASSIETAANAIGRKR